MPQIIRIDTNKDGRKDTTVRAVPESSFNTKFVQDKETGFLDGREGIERRKDISRKDYRVVPDRTGVLRIISKSHEGEIGGRTMSRQQQKAMFARLNK